MQVQFKKVQENACRKASESIWLRNQPYPAAFEHPRVNQVRAHQGHVNAVLLRSLQLMAQGLVEANGTKLAGTVILGGMDREQVSPIELWPPAQPHDQRESHQTRLIGTEVPPSY